MISSPDDWIKFNERMLNAKDVIPHEDADIKYAMVMHKRNESEIKFIRSVGWEPYNEPNLCHQQFHLAKGVSVIPELMGAQYYFEVGAGLGYMAKLLLDKNKSSLYDIYDLPAMKTIQRNFLWDDKDRIFWQNYPDQPVFHMAHPSALIACYSLSEMPLNKRLQFITKHPFDYYMIIYQPRWADIDNVAWANEIIDITKCDIKWKIVDDRYLIGKRT